MFEANTTLLINIVLIGLGIAGVIYIVIICLSRILIKDVRDVSNKQETKVLLRDGHHVGPTNWPHLYTAQWISRDERPDRPHLYTARWTFVLANWTAVLAVAGIGAAVVAVATLNAIQQQVDAMHDDFVATNRPWVTVASLNLVNQLLLGLPKGNVEMIIRWELINTGRTPAFSVVPNFFGLAETRGSDLDARKTIREKCEEARVAPFSPFATGVLLTPGKTFKSTENIAVSIPKTIIDKAKSSRNGRDFIVPLIGGCITYQFVFGEQQRHETGFLYWIYGPDTMIYLDGGNIDADKLNLVERGGGWAD